MRFARAVTVSTRAGAERYFLHSFARR